jgi:hypothetical protein
VVQDLLLYQLVLTLLLAQRVLLGQALLVTQLDRPVLGIQIVLEVLYHPVVRLYQAFLGRQSDPLVLMGRLALVVLQSQAGQSVPENHWRLEFLPIQVFQRFQGLPVDLGHLLVQAVPVFQDFRLFLECRLDLYHPLVRVGRQNQVYLDSQKVQHRLLVLAALLDLVVQLDQTDQWNQAVRLLLDFLPFQVFQKVPLDPVDLAVLHLLMVQSCPSDLQNPVVL